MSESWRSVANALAARLNHAEPDHTPPDDCPYCQDFLAYERYRAKVKQATGRDLPDQMAGMTRVSLADLMRRTDGGTT